MSSHEYVEKLVNNFITEITDQVFLSIERDDETMREYMHNVNRFGLEELNRAIGLKIKDRLKLEHDGENHHPKSRLIQSYTIHRAQ